MCIWHHVFMTSGITDGHFITIRVHRLSPCAPESRDSSVGRAEDCRWYMLTSLGRWFKSGSRELLFFQCYTSNHWFEHSFRQNSQVIKILWILTVRKQQMRKFIGRLLHQDVKLKKYVYRLIIMFLPTEIFSKRRKIYSWMKRNQSVNFTAHSRSHVSPKSRISVYFLTLHILLSITQFRCMGPLLIDHWNNDAYAWNWHILNPQKCLAIGFTTKKSFFLT